MCPGSLGSHLTLPFRLDEEAASGGLVPRSHSLGKGADDGTPRRVPAQGRSWVNARTQLVRGREDLGMGSHCF